MEKLGKPLESILSVSWCAPDDPCNIQITQQCKLQGHVGTAIQALGFGRDRAASRPRRCAQQSGFARSSPHPHAGLLIYCSRAFCRVIVWCSDRAVAIYRRPELKCFKLDCMQCSTMDRSSSGQGDRSRSSVVLRPCRGRL